MMKKQVLFIHGAGEGAYQEDKNLAENLRHSLGPSYEVRCPQMKNESDAPYELWASQIKGELASMNGSVYLVGHSVGGSVLIKFLCENNIKNSVTGVFLVASPFWGGDGGWTYDGYETLALPKEAPSKLPKDTSLFLYHSKDDETVPFAHLALFAKAFPTAKLRELNGRGHQLNNDLSEIAQDIKAL